MDPYSENQTPESPKGKDERLQKISIEELASITHEDITKAGASVLDILTSPDNDTEAKLREAWAKYAQVTEVFVDSFEEPKARSRAQIAGIINKALIFQFANHTQRYLEELDVAEVYATNEGLEDISATLTAEIHDQAKQLDVTPETLILKLKGSIEDSNREYLRDLLREGLDLEDLLISAYGMILHEDGDPDEIFLSIGITE